MQSMLLGPLKKLKLMTYQGTSHPGAGYAPHIFVHVGFKTQSLPRNVALLRIFISSYAELRATFKHAKYHFEDLETP